MVFIDSTQIRVSAIWVTLLDGWVPLGNRAPFQSRTFPHATIQMAETSLPRLVGHGGDATVNAIQLFHTEWTPRPDDGRVILVGYFNNHTRCVSIRIWVAVEQHDAH